MALPMIAGLYVGLGVLGAGSDEIFIMDGRFYAYEPPSRVHRLGQL
jgi:hypothetical protein